MLRILDSGTTLCDGLTRREWMRVGGIGLGGLTMSGLASARARAAVGGPAPKAKSVIIFGLLGGPPQHETWDPKPEAPAEIRGQFGTIESKTPGLRVGELMPRTAALTDRIAVLRAMVTGDNAHSSSGYQMLTGTPHVPLNAESVTARAPNFAPSLGAVVRFLKRDVERLPAAVTLPEHIWNDGNFPWPGQDGGVLGTSYHPWLLHCDPSAAKPEIPALALPEGIEPLRFDGRRNLLNQLDEHLGATARRGAAASYSVQQQKAFDLLSAGGAREAFDLTKEPEAVRERYGKSRFAQSVLLARRLVEAGVSLVQVNWTRIKDQLNQGGWDTHAKHNPACKDLLMPMMDQCYSALLEDLAQRGLLDETLVVWFGEFGRTPKFNGNGGRDHWGHCFSLALAGGGVRGGVVYGQSDRDAAYPVEGVVRAADLQATIFQLLGYAPETQVYDTLNRPLAITKGTPVEAIF